MGKLFYIMGKSSSGKDTIYSELLARKELNLQPFIIYTTRPIRSNEIDGVHYHFVTVEKLEQMQADGKVIELRTYQTMHGPWNYFTADSEAVDMERNNYIGLGTPESYVKIKRYYGEERVVPIYIEVEDGLRLYRALSRERSLEMPKYEEMCRRFLADQKDFCEENIAAAGIKKRFYNNETLDACLNEVVGYIKREMMSASAGDKK